MEFSDYTLVNILPIRSIKRILDNFIALFAQMEFLLKTEMFERFLLCYCYNKSFELIKLNLSTTVCLT